MLKVVRITACLAFALVPSSGAFASIDPSTGTPSDLPSLVGACTPVIAAQYANPGAPRGGCINPTGSFLRSAATTNPNGLGQVVADTVTSLVKLYKPGTGCKLHQTELPDAIRLAEGYTKDPVQVKALKDIVQAIEQCQDISTASTTGVPVSPA